MPLHGKRILVTETVGQPSPLRALLTDEGVSIFGIPVLSIVRVAESASWGPIFAPKSLDEWILITSQHTVGFLLEEARQRGALEWLAGRYLYAAIGERTAIRLKQAGLKTNFTPTEFHAEALVREFCARFPHPTGLIFPRAQQARTVIKQGLERAGHSVHEIEVYRSVVPDWKDQDYQTISGNFDWLIFSSGQSVVNFVKRLPEDQQTKWFHTPTLCIGPVTARMARQRGFQQIHRPTQATFTGMRDYLRNHA